MAETSARASARLPPEQPPAPPSPAAASALHADALPAGAPAPAADDRDADDRDAGDLLRGAGRWQDAGRWRPGLLGAGLPGLGALRSCRAAGGDPLLRNAYALMLNTGVSAVLGLGFWLAAARWYPQAAVGQGSAAIAAMKFLAGLTAVTLTGALARFLPVAGRRTGSLVRRTYLASSAVVAAGAAVFLLTLGRWGPSYRFLHGALPGLAFTGAVVGWSLLTLQDGVLTGLRSAVWVPVGNTVFSTGKLVLLVVLAGSAPLWGVFASWAAAVGLSVLPLGWLVFRRLIPRHVAATSGAAGTAAPPTARRIARFLAGDCTGSLFALAVVYLLPVIVAARISAQQNACFYVTATIGGTVDLLAVNMGASLTVEGAHDPSRIAANCRAALRRTARIVIPVCLALAVFAPEVLGVFGPAYAAGGTPLLRLLAAASLTRVVAEVYFGVLRARSLTSRLALLQGLLCVLILGLTWVLLPVLGITGAGLAVLAGESAVAVACGWGLMRLLRPPAGPAAAAARPAAESAAADADSTRSPAEPAVASADSTRSPAEPPAEPAVPDARAATGPPGTARAAAGPVAPPAGPTSAGTGTAAWPRTQDTAPAAPPPPARRPGPPIRLRGRLPEVGGWLVLAASLALYWLPLRGLGSAALDRMNGLGLVSVLPPATLFGAAGLVLAFCWALWLRRPLRLLPAAVLLATVVSLHAVPAVLEAQPRFPTAWQHAGFVEFVGRTGTALPYLDARYSWPGFFALVALVTRACGITDLTGVLRWWPTAMELLYLLPLALLLTAVRASRRAKWSAAWLFALCGWVGQDYFSPQSLDYFLYLVFVAVLVVWFRSPHQRGGRLLPGEAMVRQARPADQVLLLALLLGVFAASVVSHQLTPFVMVGTAGALALRRRLTLRGLPLLCGVLVAGWVGFLAEPYWSGHFADLFGSLGSLGGNVTAGVAGRIAGGDRTHKLVLYTRVMLAAGVLALAAFGLLRRRRAGIGDRVLPIVTLVPFLGLALQSYGGEMALRVFLFALPGAAVLAALAIFPRAAGGRRERWGAAAALLAGLVLIGGFLVARWGNEPFERVGTGEVAALDYLYRHDTPSVRVLWPSKDPVTDVTPNLPWMARDMEKTVYVPVLAPRDPSRIEGLVAALQNAGPNSYLVVGRGDGTYLRLDAGYPAGWRTRLLTALDRSGAMHRVMADPEAAVYRLATPPPGPAPQPVVGAIGPVITWTPWSVAGAAAGILLLVLLAAREVLRLLVPRRRRQRWMRLSLTAAMPLLAVFLVSLVDRFVTLS